MRFATYEEHGRSRVATVGNDGVLHPHPGTASLLDLIQAGPEALREAPCACDSDGFLRLVMTAEINGEVVGKDLLSNMSWTFEEMATYASRSTHVRPCDTVTLTVEGIGTVSNTVVPGAELVAIPRARPRPRTRP